MSTDRDEPGTGPVADRRVLVGLGLAYLLVGVGFFYGILADSFDVLVLSLGGVLVLLVPSLYLVVRQEGLVTAENKLIGAFVLVATGLLVSLSGLTDLASEIVFGVVLVVGVGVPWLLLQFTDYGGDEADLTRRDP